RRSELVRELSGDAHELREELLDGSREALHLESTFHRLGRRLGFDDEEGVGLDERSHSYPRETVQDDPNGAVLAAQGLMDDGEGPDRIDVVDRLGGMLARALR